MTHLEHPLELAPFINSFYLEHPHDDLTYHNLGHTEQVVQAAREIASHSNLSDEDTEIVVAAAWFHDTGHLTGGIEDHEKRSVEIMRNYMYETGVTDSAFLYSVEALHPGYKISAPARKPTTGNTLRCRHLPSGHHPISAYR